MKSKPQNTIKKTAYLGLFLSLAMILSYVEHLLPVFPFAPGVKIGLANSFILLILYLYGPKEAACINLLRIVLSTLLFGSLYSLMYSAAGAVFSFLVMWLCYRFKDRFSSIGIGILGGLFHNLGQFLIALFVTKLPGLLFYLPILIAMGMLCGAITGSLVRIAFPRLKSILSNEKGAK